MAFLRGLLKPDYKKGQTSILAENLVLSALQREVQQQELEATVLMYANVLGNSNLKSTKSASDKYRKAIHDSYQMLLFRNNKKGPSQNLTKSEIDATSKFLNAIDKLKQKSNG